MGKANAIEKFAALTQLLSTVIQQAKQQTDQDLVKSMRKIFFGDLVREFGNRMYYPAETLSSAFFSVVNGKLDRSQITQDLGLRRRTPGIADNNR